MRTISDQLQAAYDAYPVLPSVYTRVEIDRTGSDDWVDMTDLFNRDWLVSAAYNENVDVAVATATVEFRARFDHLNLSPFVAASPLNTGGVLIQAYRRLRIKTATLPHGYTPQEADYVLVFRGRITQYSLRGHSIVVQCRDDAGELQDRYIEEGNITRGDDDGTVQVETVMQDILDAHYNTAPSDPFPLYSENGTAATPFDTGSDSPGWAIAAYLQQRQPVMDALRVLAESLGYRLQMRFLESDVNDFVLVFEEPDRAIAANTFTFNNVMSIDGISQNLADIRNVVRVVYEDSGGRRQTVEVTDAASVTKYGRRWMEIQEESASQINSGAEATTLATAARDDLAEPEAVLQFTVPYFYPGQFQDLYGIPDPTGVYADTSFVLSPLSFAHMPTQGVTRITCRGRPVARLKGWTGRQSRSPTRQWGALNFSNATPLDSVGIISNGFLRNWTKG